MRFSHPFSILTLVIGFAACGTKEEPAPPVEAPPVEAPAVEPPTVEPAHGALGGGEAKPAESWDDIVQAAVASADRQCTCPDRACLEPAFAEAKALAERAQALAQPDRLGAPTAEVGARLGAEMMRIRKCMSDEQVQAWVRGEGGGGELVLVTEAAARAICACADVDCVLRIQKGVTERAGAAAAKGAPGEGEVQRISAATERMTACVSALGR